MSKFNIPIWKSSPFIRLLLPLIAGIVFQYYVNQNILVISAAAVLIITVYLFFQYRTISIRYKYNWLQGVFLNLIIFCIGIALTHHKEIKNDSNWFGNSYTDSSALVLSITEPPTEKDKSYKTTASVIYITNNGETKKLDGNVLIYFSKTDSTAIPKYGDEILIHGGLQKIKNAGNPGGFNYSRYMGFQETYHQVYLQPKDFLNINNNHTSFLYRFIYAAREKVISIVQQNVVGDKKVTGIVEALLIGYKEDLDKDVVQAYSNTGVVHIIAISGMHLGLIYAVLVWLFARTPIIKKSKITQVILILISLWLFSLITGGSASVMRSAVMFTCIIVGKTFYKQAAIYNSLATSAFLLLCYNPFLLWDVGFQLSYTAVVGIVWLQKPIENLYYSKYKAVQYIWKMCAITLAAQVLTLPVCIYYFHQIPTLFLFTNIICVPLSTSILFAEILLIIISAFTPLALLVGKLIYWLTWLMNYIIEFFNALPGSLIDKVYANEFTSLALYAFVILFASSLLKKNKTVFKLSLCFLFIFSTIWSYGKIKLAQQKKMIVYNVSKHRAVDFIVNDKYQFYGDDTMKIDGALQNFNLKPARVLLQISLNKDSILQNNSHYNFCNFYEKKMLFIDSAVNFNASESPLSIDVLVISKSPKIYLPNLLKAVKPTSIVFDGSNSLWKITQWKKVCDSLHLQYHSTIDDGAFTLDVN